MFSVRRRITAGLVVATMFVGLAPSRLAAQENLQPTPAPAGAANATEPVLVVTVAAVNKLMQDVNYLSSVVGQPQAGGMFTMMAGTFTQGVNMDEPMAVLVPLVDGIPEPIAMLPTSDVKAVLKRLEAQTGPVDELDDGTLVIAIGASTVYVRQSGNWAVLARNRALLDLAPADPSTLFEGLGNQYDIAFRLKMQLVPPQTREMLANQLRQGFEQAMQNQGDDAEANRQMAEGTLDQIEQFIQETDELKFGFNIDQAQKQLAIDVSFTAVQGTELSEMYGAQRAIPSRFASVIRDDAAGYYHAATSISPAMVEQTRNSTQMSIQAVKNALANEDDLSPEQVDQINQLIDRLSDLAVASIAEGKADLGALLLADSNKLQFVLGSFVADGNEAAAIVKDVAEKLKNEPNAPRFKFDQGKHQDVALHVMEVDIPADQDEARKVFGETAQLHIGTGPKAVYLAFGMGSDTLMKQLIDSGARDNGGDRPVGQLRVQLLPILQYVQSIEANDSVSAMIDALSRSPDPGLLRAVNTSIPNGLESQVTLGEGLLQAIGAAARHAQQQQMQQQGGQF